MAYLDLGDRFSSECVLLLHGEPSHGMLYRKMTPQLVSAGFRVVVPDLIGFGKSDKFGKQSTYTYDR
jgi:haloalkane dehalogenase